jgi:peptidoglycan/LPS O-acetylase OafA/YrhL
MFGLFRTYLAFWVVAHHLMAVPYLGKYAVQGFFVLSGYLMALVVTQVYGYSLRGFLVFAGNRLLRLLPSYWVVLCLTVFVILIVGNQTASTFRSAMYLPQTLSQWAQNATMIYPDWVPSRVSPRLSPATWALTVELFYYALIGLGLFRYRALTWAIFGLALVYHIATIILGYGFDSRYSFIPAGALAFSIGGLIYHYRFQLERSSPSIVTTYALFLVSFPLIGFIAEQLDNRNFLYVSRAIYYVNLGVSALAVAWLSKPSQSLSSKRDRFIGDFSYHLYIAHWVVGLIVGYFILDLDGPTKRWDGVMLLTLTVIFCAILSLILRRYVDHPVERLRKSFRRSRQTTERTSS